jgi:uncharacterized FlgJ-related protein
MKFIFLLLLMLPFISFKNEDKITYQGLYNEILEQGLEFPDIVFAQAILESGHFKSKVFKENNNLFGMRQPSKRATVSKGRLNGYAVYDFWQESVEDYYLYQEYTFRKRTFTRSEYLSRLNKSYASTSGYSEKLLSIIKRFKNILYDPPSDRNDGDLFNNSNP